MGKKRKAGGRPFGQIASVETEPSGKTRFHRDEEFVDSEDEFHLRRDRILLDEGPEAKRRRKIEEQDEFLQASDEEILGYESEASDGDEVADADDDVTIRVTQSARATHRNFRSSEEPEQEEEEGLGGWGTSKQDYYNADKIETEADALEEEEEARRIQQKRLQGMTEADFGFDETEWLEPAGHDEEDEDEGGVVTEILPQLEIKEDMGAEERLKIMKTRYPEFEPLAKDFVDLQVTHQDLEYAAAAAEAVVKHAQSPKVERTRELQDTKSPTPVAVIKLRALSAYLGAISMYLALLTSASRNTSGSALAMSTAELRDHNVMDSLVQCRKLWEKARDLPIPDVAEVAENEAENAYIEKAEEPVPTVNDVTHSVPELKAAKKKKKSKAERAEEAAQAEAETRRTERLRKTEEGLADLSSLINMAPPRKPRAQVSKNFEKQKGNDSDLGDEIALTAHEAAEKAKRKKSLRFYTSQIAQKANKRGAAGRDAGGDADLPHRERLKDRQARLNAEAERRGKKQIKGAEELGGESDDEDRRVAQEIRAGADGSEDDYYDMVAARTTQRKSDKKRLAEAYAQAAKEGGRVEVQEDIGPDGKRAITYAIEKNKGLTPKRKKEVRNPRVKKRKKFEEKKKKLGSIRPVYKGGEGPGGYSGELTGIKKNLVKSVKL